MADDVLFSQPNQLAMSDEEYELAMAITHLLKSRDRIGITDETVLSGSKDNPKSGNATIIRYAVEVFKVWAALFPHEHRQFIENTKYELDHERPVKQAIKAGGYSPIAFPVRLDNLYHTLIPGVKTQDKRFWIPLLSYIPELRRSNYA